MEKTTTTPTIAQLEAALTLARDRGDLRRQGALLLALGEAWGLAKEPERSRRAYADAVDACMDAHQGPWAVEASLRLSTAALERGDWAEAAAWLERAQEAPDLDLLPLATLARLHHNLGLSRVRQGSVAGAIASYRRSLELWRQIDAPVSRATTLLSLGEAELLRGDAEAAVLHLTEGWFVHRDEETLNRREAAAVTELLGEAQLRTGDAAAGARSLRSSLELWEQEGDEGRLLAVLLRLARGLLADEHADHSAEVAVLLEHYAEHVTGASERLYGWLKLAEVLEEGGHPDRASVALVRAAAIAPDANPDAPDQPRRLLRRAAELGVAAVPEQPDPWHDAEAWAEQRSEALRLGEELYSRALDTEGAAWCRQARLKLLLERRRWAEAAELIAQIRQRDVPQEPGPQAHWLAHAARIHLEADQADAALSAARGALELMADLDDELKAALEALAESLEGE